ncbi:MAG: NADH-quinone oxidoreductase subunit L [Burkholderiales bacterium]|nr:MAG: NADH-quinone oxidoreductase subunit L [Burkholderiales bacterium]
MDGWFDGLRVVAALAPVVLMALLVLLPTVFPHRGGSSGRRLWQGFMALTAVGVPAPVLVLWLGPEGTLLPGWLHLSALGLGLALLVQVLGLVIGAFSARYLEGEEGQGRYVAALSGVLAAVHLLLLADHWVLLVGAWALVGVALQPLLCFYPDRAFARLAAHKKRLADRLADILLLAAAALAWSEVGSGSLTDLRAHLAGEGASLALQLSAVALVLAVIVRTALLPLHGWLIQVMEAPTPVSALMHAGVVNLGGFILIRFAPLLEQALLARGLLVVFGLATAVLAGMVMLTRISIKVRLAWSTVAQMGFMLLECGLGLYTLAALHLIGHSLYKAHAFLAASSVVRQTRWQALHTPAAVRPASLLLAPLLTVGVVAAVQALAGGAAWPWWWSLALGLAWAPLLWLPLDHAGPRSLVRPLVAGMLMVGALTGLAWLVHALPLGLQDAPAQGLGLLALAGLAGLYLCLAVLQWRPSALGQWRRRSYAGFYLDEVYTRLALKLWPVDWMPVPAKPEVCAVRPPSLADGRR